MSLRLSLCLSAALLVGSGSSVVAEPNTANDRCREVRPGVVSWYGEGFHGRKTANGETYNKFAMTAASVSLPMGTRARVTNPGNGRQIEVRVNDRGPYARNAAGKFIPHPIRTIDLSEEAATQLGIRELGVAPVLIQLLCG